MLYAGLYIVALATSRVRASLSTHRADQFDENDPKERRLISIFLTGTSLVYAWEA
jgi:peptide/histidine transporter 3/4